ncbi:MAG: deoxyribodipyrimidine photo-lyase [Deltaproteobacteria bacterium]|nr:deoxyribodipyrimidine photo-lyase [Deltaproteobacteria bacterium]
MTSEPILLWCRRDLRLKDNPALLAAVATGRPIIPVFIWSPSEEKPWAPGAATKWWLHHSLLDFQLRLQEKKSDLIFREGKSLESLRRLIQEAGATSIFWNRLYEPKIRQRDEEIKDSLKKDGLEVRSFNSYLLFEPWTIQNLQKKPFQVFSPYWKNCLSQKYKIEVQPAPKKIISPATWPKSQKLSDFELIPKIRWYDEMAKAWTPGEDSAQKQLKRFIKDAAADYPKNRDYPSILGTSKISAHLHFGEISIRDIWNQLKELGNAKSEIYLKELGWREFAYHLLYHFPDTPQSALRTEFEKFPWDKNSKNLKAWQKGMTGYPIVDAGMRELWATGWMHNRVRMIVASFLTKHLRQTWLNGAEWFWETLVDADLANNTLGWQWAGGCGADAAPYFRIFNPILQGEKFDPDGIYIKKWIPELKNLPASIIHTPWESDLPQGKYPKPIVDHKEARALALKAFASLKKK